MAVFFGHTPLTEKQMAIQLFYGFFSTTCRKNMGGRSAASAASEPRPEADLSDGRMGCQARR